MSDLFTGTAEHDVLTVSRLNREAKSLLEGSFPLLWIEGEISNFSRPASGHFYFSLKDAQAQVRCALFRGNQRGLGVLPKDGMHVLLRARVTLYEGRGDFQLIVETLEEAGEGALRRAFEQLKHRLLTEGLFDVALKKPLPLLPKRVGVITSPSGAVLHDILTTLKRRFPAIPVLVHPVPVQGEGAAGKIAAMIALAGKRLDCDVLILARGGGSLEDLWPFNEEIVARAIHACPIPVVSGVGHETDFTIADLVADARATTPTAAAEMLSPDSRDWLLRLANTGQRLARLINQYLLDATQDVDRLSLRLIHPRQRLAGYGDRVQQLQQRLQLAQFHLRGGMQHRLAALGARLQLHNPRERLRSTSLRFGHLQEQLTATLRHTLTRLRERAAHAAHALDNLSPLSTLARGYAILENPVTHKIVRNARDIQPGESLRARLSRGYLECRVEAVHESE